MDTYRKSGGSEEIALGSSLLRSGKAGCIVLAGGDGTRLGWEGPKGTFPIWKEKTLFQLLEERFAAACELYGRKLHLAVMTSPNNHEETRSAISPAFDLFTQPTLPLLDQERKPLQEQRPSGNGQALQSFYRSGIYEKWKNSGVEIVQVIQIDNPLAEPFDPNLIGVHAQTNAEVCVKAVLRKNPEEKVGVLGEKEGRIRVVEYTENPPKEWNIASIGLFSFSMEFIEKIKEVQLPLHEAHKTYQGKPVIKREYFLFDLLPYSEKTEVLLYPRDEIFAPLKTQEDIASVQRALSLYAPHLIK